MNPFSLVNQILPKMHWMPKGCNCIKLCKPWCYCASLVVMVTKLNPIRSVLRALSSTKSARRVRCTCGHNMRRELKYCRLDFLVISFLIVINQELNCLVLFFQGMPGTKFPDALLVVPSFPPSKPIIQAFLDSGFYFRLALPVLCRVFLQVITSCTVKSFPRQVCTSWTVQSFLLVSTSYVPCRVFLQVATSCNVQSFPPGWHFLYRAEFSFKLALRVPCRLFLQVGTSCTVQSFPSG